MSHGGDLVTNLSDSVTSWTVPHQAPLSMGFSRQEYWSGLAFPSPGNLPNPGVKPVSPSLAGRFFTTEPLGKPIIVHLQPIRKLALEGAAHISVCQRRSDFILTKITTVQSGNVSSQS